MGTARAYKRMSFSFPRSCYRVTVIGEGRGLDVLDPERYAGQVGAGVRDDFIFTE